MFKPRTIAVLFTKELKKGMVIPYFKLYISNKESFSKPSQTYKMERVMKMV